MIIKKLRLFNFKSHGETIIEFETGITIIMGENGAGKSSILEAINFVLFKRHYGRNMDQLIKNGSKKMEVELQFVCNGREYKIKRGRGRSSFEAKIDIWEGNKFVALATKDRPVTEEVQKLLEMDSDLFLNAVYVRQGEISDLIEKTPSEKKKMIGKLLGIESLETAWNNMLPLIQVYEHKKSNIEGKIEDLPELEEELRNLNYEKNSYESKINDLNTKLEEFEKYLKENKAEKQNLEEKKSIYDELNRKIEQNLNLKNQINEGMNELQSEIEQIIFEEKKISKIKPQIMNLEYLKKHQECLNELEKLNEDKNREKKALNEINELNKILDQNIEGYNKYSQFKIHLDELTLKRKEFEGSNNLENQLQEQKRKLSSRIEVAKKVISKTLKEYNEILDIHTKSIEEFEGEFENIVPDLENKRFKIEKIQQKLNKKISILEFANKSLEKPISELESAPDSCPVCLAPLDDAKRESLVNDYRLEIMDNQKEIAAYNSKLLELEPEKKVTDNKYKILKKINTQLLHEKLETLKENEESLHQIESDLINIKDKVANLREIDEQLEATRQQQMHVEQAHLKYVESQGALKSRKPPQEHYSNLEIINQNLDRVSSRINKYKQITGVEDAQIRQKILQIEELQKESYKIEANVSKKPMKLEKIENLRNKLNNLNNSIKADQDQLEKIDYNPEKHNHISSKVDGITSKISIFRSEQSNYEGSLDMVLKSLENKEKQLQSYKSKENELKNVKDYIKLLSLIRTLFGKDGIQRELRNRSKPIIEQRTREFFEKFNFDYSDIRIDQDYDITIYGPNGESSLDMISGGERIAVALALRLGITQALSGGKLELVMLDEPTIHLDSYRRQELIDLMKRMSIIPQMIIVTHDYDLQDAADNVLTIKKEEGNSFIISS